MGGCGDKRDLLMSKRDLLMSKRDLLYIHRSVGGCGECSQLAIHSCVFLCYAGNAFVIECVLYRMCSL